MIKRIILLTVVVAIIIIAVITWFVFYGGNDSNMVLKIPSGFVHLHSNLRNGLNIMPFETQITFLDADGVGIYQTGFKNSEFIVKYKGEYYVNEERLLELIDVAAISPEQRHQTYNVGDTVEIRGTGETIYYVQIISLKDVATEPFYDDILTMYYITYSLTSNTNEKELRYFYPIVETKQGVSYSELDFINAETVSVKIRARGADGIGAIVLKSPDYPGLSYRIVTSE